MYAAPTPLKCLTAVICDTAAAAGLSHLGRITCAYPRSGHWQEAASLPAPTRTHAVAFTPAHGAELEGEAPSWRVTCAGV